MANGKTFLTKKKQHQGGCAWEPGCDQTICQGWLPPPGRRADSFIAVIDIFGFRKHPPRPEQKPLIPALRSEGSSRRSAKPPSTASAAMRGRVVATPGFGHQMPSESGKKTPFFVGSHFGVPHLKCQRSVSHVDNVCI